ncbi:hypothetical protein, partial [Brachyspira murdochii]|uniref:hypothetical protein n=1 Tax=Brachyspira murdochii TaxID=84378 RepID=UPI001CA5410B
KLIKYWNKEQKVITVSSYLLETMMIKYFQSNNDCNDIFILFMNALEYISKNILGTLNDPKKIQGDLIEEEDLNYKEKKVYLLKLKKTILNV